MMDTATRGIIIVGQSHLQSSVIAGLLKEATGLSCPIVMPDRITPLTLARPAGLLLFDAKDASLAALIERVEARGALPEAWHVALYDVEPEHPAEYLVCWSRLRGLFYRDASERLFVQGVIAILGGEYWLPRRLLIRHLERTRSFAQTQRPAAEPLTAKESEILSLIAEGQSNGEIADSLGISRNTVKTHVYNLFRKINAANRIQAVNWNKSRSRPGDSISAAGKTQGPARRVGGGGV